MVQAYPLVRGVTSAIALVFSVDVRRGTLVQGTGFSVEPDGYLITSLHVVLPSYMNPRNPLLVLFNDAAYFSRIVCADDTMDIAVLRIDAHNLPHLKLTGLSAVHEGDEVFALSYPGRGKLMFSEGKIEKIYPGGEVKFIVTSAPLSYGSSGGPLLNSRGEVVGVASFILVRDRVRSMGVSADNVRELLSRCGIK